MPSLDDPVFNEQFTPEHFASGQRKFKALEGPTISEDARQTISCREESKRRRTMINSSEGLTPMLYTLDTSHRSISYRNIFKSWRSKNTSLDGPLIDAVYTNGLHRSNLHREAVEARMAEMYSPDSSVMEMIYIPECPVFTEALSGGSTASFWGCTHRMIRC